MAPSIPYRVAGLSVLAASLLAAPAFAASSAEILAVTASSTDGMLMDAVDDDPTTAWRARAGVHDAWLAVRFVQPASLKGISLQTGPMPAGESLDVETSKDGRIYDTQLVGRRVDTDKATPFMFSAKTTALYVRVRFHYQGAGTPPRFEIEELQALPAI